MHISKPGSKISAILLMSALLFALPSGTTGAGASAANRSSDQNAANGQAKPSLHAGASIPASGGRTQEPDCTPNTGVKQMHGPAAPHISAQAQERLQEVGISAHIEATSYGEVDNCGTFTLQAMDFRVNLPQTDLSDPAARQQTIDVVLPMLRLFGKPKLGNVTLVDSRGTVIPVDTQAPVLRRAQDAEPLPPDAVFKKVYVIVYNPLLSNGQTLSEYQHWSNYLDLTQQAIDFFKQTSKNKLNYSVVDTTVVTNEWPEKKDGFSYPESEYLEVVAGHHAAHLPDEVNYDKIVNSAQFDICGKLNRGDIDEVWIYNAPWFGFYEATLIGPNTYYFVSFSSAVQHSCNKLLPIMGPSQERGVADFIHDFGHRAEATMSKVYGDWLQNETTNNWEKFALAKGLSPDYSYSGCGNVHFPPNATGGYDYSSVSTALSNCDDFANFPNLGNPLQVSQPVTCAAWGCTDIGYYAYWFGHLPANAGCGPDGVANDWWGYFANPALALYPSRACQANLRVISGNLGVKNTTLNYTDDGPKSVTSDNYGNYFLIVPDQWAGTVTPNKAGCTFSPPSRTYPPLTSDQTNADYEFTQEEYSLTVLSEHGTVSRWPDQATYHSGDIVELSASPDAGWRLESWSGAVAGVHNAGFVTILGNTTVTANYGIEHEYSLTITSAHGTVVKSPNKATYHEEDMVSLTARPNTGWHFTGWSGTVSIIGNPAIAFIHGDTAITANYAPNTPPVTLTSIGAQDGWVLEGSEKSNAGGAFDNLASTFRLGDDKSRRQYRSILSFNTTAGLPRGASIIGVTLNIKKQAIVGGGDPLMALQGLMVDIKTGTFSTAMLQAGDFKAAASKTSGPFQPVLTGGWYSIDLTAASGSINRLALGSGVTQIRLRFKLDDNNNAVANYLSLYSGNASAANRPQLVITYYVP